MMAATVYGTREDLPPEVQEAVREGERRASDRVLAALRSLRRPRTKRIETPTRGLDEEA